MVAVAIRIKTTMGSEGSAVDAWTQALSDPSPALKAVGEMLREDVEMRFQTESDPWGNAWAPLSPVTVALRAKAGQLGKILQRTRNLANSAFWRLDDTKRRVVVSLSAPYARVQHFGNPSNKLFGKTPAPIPARPILPLRGGRVDLAAEMRTELLETFKDSIRLALRRARGAA